MQGEWWNNPKSERTLDLIRLAKVGCATDARMAERTLRQWFGRRIEPAAARLIIERRPTWLDTVYDRLAENLGEWDQLYSLLELLRTGLDRERPRTDAYLRAYLAHQHGSPIESDPEFLALLPAILQAEAVGNLLFGQWPQQIAGLANDGLVDRAELIRVSLQALLRGGRPGHLRPFVQILRDLALTTEELRRDRGELVRLVSGTPSFAATFAVDALRRLEQSEPLPDEALRELSAAVFARSEKAIATKQLTWIGSRAKDPTRVDAWIGAVVDALAHERPDVQEQALKLLAKLWPHASPASRAQVAFAIDGVAPRLRDDARRLVGETTTPPSITVRAAEESVSVMPLDEVHPIADLDELVQAIARFVESGDGLEAERVFDGLLRFARTDRATLVDAFAPLLPRLPVPGKEVLGSWMRDVSIVHLAGERGVLGFLLHSLVGESVGPADGLFSSRHAKSFVKRAKEELTSLLPFDGPISMSTKRSSPTVLRFNRLREIAEHVPSGRAVGLLALPTHSSGQVDPATLVRRMAALEEAGDDAWPFDLHQAVLRLPRSRPPHVVAAARNLRSTQGRLLAASIDEPHRDPRSERIVAKKSEWGEGRVVLAALHGVGAVEDRYGFAGTSNDTGGATWWELEWADRWSITLPSHREVVCAHALRFVHETWSGDRASTDLAPQLPLMEGPVGVATCGLILSVASSKQPARRAGASDAIIGLVEAGELPGDLFAGEFAALAEEGVILASRVGPVLTDAARASAICARWIWDVLQISLPGFLARKARDTHLLLALAADVVSDLGLRGEVSGLGEIADTKGSSRLVVEARRLKGALGV